MFLEDQLTSWHFGIVKDTYCGSKIVIKAAVFMPIFCYRNILKRKKRGKNSHWL